MKKLTREEKFVCEMIWGGVPVDEAWVRTSKYFQVGMEKFATGVWNEFLPTKPQPKENGKVE